MAWSRGGIRRPRLEPRTLYKGLGATQPSSAAGTAWIRPSGRLAPRTTARAKSACVSSPWFARCQMPHSPSIRRSSAAATRCGRYEGEIVTSSATKNGRPAHTAWIARPAKSSPIPRREQGAGADHERLRAGGEHRRLSLEFARRIDAARGRRIALEIRTALAAIEDQMGRPGEQPDASCRAASCDY